MAGDRKKKYTDAKRFNIWEVLFSLWVNLCMSIVRSAYRCLSLLNFLFKDKRLYLSLQFSWCFRHPIHRYIHRYKRCVSLACCSSWGRKIRHGLATKQQESTLGKCEFPYVCENFSDSIIPYEL